MGNVLQSEGLVPALEDFSSRVAQTAGFEIHLETDPVPRLSEQAGSTILGVVKEAVANAKAHAEADNVWITVHRQEDMLEVSVRDDGRGFDLEAVKARYREQGLDPAGDMRARVEAIQGELAIHSAAGQGTTIRVTAPLSVNLAAGA
jgi:signal transduction histidine kinase